MQLENSYLNGPFNYNIYPLIIVLILLIITIVVFIYFNIHIKNKKDTKPVIVPAKDINTIKNKYLKELNDLASSIDSLKLRKVYNRLSIIIRSFVYEATNIDVLKYSLNEIKELHIDSLTLLVTEYYEPEFSKESNSDATLSINKAKEVIDKWK